MTQAHNTRLLLVGAPGTEFRLAAEMARGSGAEVTMADTMASGMAQLRASSIGLVMIDVEADVPAFMAQLLAERFAVPVVACGIDAPATLAVAAIRAGARDYLPLPPDRELIAAAIRSAVAGTTSSMIGRHPAFVRATAFGLAMAHARVPVLIHGEHGAGKEVLARAIHDASGRAGRFMVVECAGVSADIVESELFGHEEGAFAGAVARRLGRLEKAFDGTVLLRDVDCLSPSTQAKLLAFLHDGAVRRLGSSELVPVSARLIASISRDVDRLIADGAFRADLGHRFGLARVNLPPLRERASDVPELAACFAEQLSRSNALPFRTISPDTLGLLAGYRWPGNVAELKDVVHRAVLLARGPAITPDDIVLIDGSLIQPAPAAADAGLAPVVDLVGRTVEEVERELILHTLQRCRGNRTSASSILGISVRTMRNKLKLFIEAGIPVAPAL